MKRTAIKPLKDLRKSLGYTQLEMASMTRINYSTYVKVEQGRITPSSPTIDKLVSYYETTRSVMVRCIEETAKARKKYERTLARKSER